MQLHTKMLQGRLIRWLHTRNFAKNCSTSTRSMQVRSANQALNLKRKNEELVQEVKEQKRELQQSIQTQREIEENSHRLIGEQLEEKEDLSRENASVKRQLIENQNDSLCITGIARTRCCFFLANIFACAIHVLMLCHTAGSARCPFCWQQVAFSIPGVYLWKKPSCAAAARAGKKAKSFSWGCLYH